MTMVIRKTRALPLVLGFDNWTKGAHHFERLVDSFAKQGMELRLTHIGSWGNDRERPKCERRGNLEIRDISFYETRSLERLIDLERPAVVILLSTETFAHRALVRYCRVRHIPTLLLCHGLVSVQVTDDQIGSYRANRLAYARFICSKLGKMVTRTLPCYIESLLKTNGTLRDWARFLSDLKRLAAGKFVGSAAEDSRTTKCAVFTNADLDYAVRTFSFDTGDVIPVGNPDLARFGLTDHLIGSRLRLHHAERGSIMYLDTGLSTLGLIFRSQQAFVDHLRETSTALRAVGRRMLFKPHPAHKIEFLRSALGDAVGIVSNESFMTRLQDCEACIAETTTLAMIPALLGMPLLYANFGRLAELRFGQVLTSYPRGYLMREIGQIDAMLRADDSGFDQKLTEEWIRNNVGPLPATRMPERVAQVAKSMIAPDMICGADSIDANELQALVSGEG